MSVVLALVYQNTTDLENVLLYVTGSQVLNLVLLVCNKLYESYNPVFDNAHVNATLTLVNTNVLTNKIYCQLLSLRFQNQGRSTAVRVPR